MIMIDIRKDKQLFNSKIITLFLIIAQVVLFFLPLNVVKDSIVSALKGFIDIINGNIALEDFDNLRINVIFALSTFATLSNILSFSGLFFAVKRKRYRGIGLSFFLSSSVIYAFCWGAMINVSGFVNTLYGFNFLALILNILILVLILKLEENEIIRKEL